MADPLDDDEELIEAPFDRGYGAFPPPMDGVKDGKFVMWDDPKLDEYGDDG